MEGMFKSRDIFQVFLFQMFPPGLGRFQEFSFEVEGMFKSRDISVTWPWTLAEIPIWDGGDVEEQEYFCQAVPDPQVCLHLNFPH